MLGNDVIDVGFIEPAINMLGDTLGSTQLLGCEASVGIMLGGEEGTKLKAAASVGDIVVGETIVGSNVCRLDRG